MHGFEGIDCGFGTERSPGRGGIKETRGDKGAVEVGEGLWGGAPGFVGDGLEGMEAGAGFGDGFGDVG